ncbi:MAG TPA: orotidine-5'-phosphate decarboxylase [Sandaracinaceae bacterium]
MGSMSPRDRIVFALDVPSLDAGRALLERVAPQVGVVKVGLELFVAEGPRAVRAVHDAGSACFLDLKLHDIPATVGRAAAAAARLGVRYLTVHASAGPAALSAAAGAVRGSPTQLLAVTALTSLDASQLSAIGFEPDPRAVVSRLASLAASCGIDGFVCAPAEVRAVRAIAERALIVVPGVRPAGSDAGDQARVATPAQAIAEGADLLVVGRPIRDAADPVQAARAIADEIARATGEAR